MRKPLEHMKIFADRRARLEPQLQGSALILTSPMETIRNGSVHNLFRQDSNLYYLTGFEEPESVFVYRPGMKPETIMFVRDKDPDKEIWDGFRFGLEGTKSEFRMEQVYKISDLENMLPDLLKGLEKVFYRFNKNSEFDRKIQSVLETVKSNAGRSGFGILPIFDADELIGELRVIKSDSDLQNLRRACEISAEAHIEVMKYVKPNMNEREAYGFFFHQIMKRGAAREGYGGIFAGGVNATTLHYVFNDEVMKSGDLLLVDAGAEYNYFTGDITRTYPINGRFNEEQAEVYTGVLDVQKAIIEAVKPGLPFSELQEMATHMLTDVMLELGLLTGRKEDIIKAGDQKKYYPHGVSHFLGMDVHDLGMYKTKDNKPRLIEEGMVFTIEPGLYIPANDTKAAKEYRGIGVRIEDNILVTARGAEVLTSKAPKEIADLEKIVGSYQSS
jgi:Xaa-Pro aminopeptidase